MMSDYGGQPAPGYGGPPPGPGFGGPQPGFGGPPPQQGFGGPQPGFGGPPPQQGFGGQPGFGGGFPPPDPAPQYAPPPQQGSGSVAPPFEAAQPQNIPADALRGFLISYQSSPSGDFWPLKGGRKTVGRSNSGENVDVPLADATISSRHAAFVVDASAGTVTIEDTGSTNGTFVNEEHLGFNGRRELKDGDRIRFGGFTTTIKIISRI
jgi:hypothetical protein